MNKTIILLLLLLISCFVMVKYQVEGLEDGCKYRLCDSKEKCKIGGNAVGSLYPSFDLEKDFMNKGIHLIAPQCDKNNFMCYNNSCYESNYCPDKYHMKCHSDCQIIGDNRIVDTQQPIWGIVNKNKKRNGKYEVTGLDKCVDCRCMN